MKRKNKLVVTSIAIKQEAKMLCFDQKKTAKVEKYITPTTFAKHHRKSDVSENSKVYYRQFLRNGLEEDIAASTSYQK